MRSVLDFIVKPLRDRYDNSVDVNGKQLIINTSVEDHKHVSREAIVISTPTAFNTGIKKGDIIVIHHNVFRRYYNTKGSQVDSSKLFDDNTFFCQIDQVYLKKEGDTWKTVGERCFVMPIKNNDKWSLDKEKRNIGILKIGNKTLDGLGVKEGDLVGFKSNREFEFLIDGQRLYCMESNDILVKHEYKGDEEEYNPSWARSG
jgi:co-chaperonin GroES (HSP10)